MMLQRNKLLKSIVLEWEPESTLARTLSKYLGQVVTFNAKTTVAHLVTTKGTVSLEDVDKNLGFVNNTKETIYIPLSIPREHILTLKVPYLMSVLTGYPLYAAESIPQYVIDDVVGTYQLEEFTSILDLILKLEKDIEKSNKAVEYLSTTSTKLLIAEMQQEDSILGYCKRTGKGNNLLGAVFMIVRNKLLECVY